MSAESQAISHNISLLLTAGRSAEARAELERLLALDADDPDARSVAGDVYAYTGAHSAAYRQYNLSAETYNKLGRADMALAVHHKILELDLGMLDAATQARIRLLALLVAAEDAVVMGHNDKAVAGFQEAIRQFPNHTITYQRLASLLVRLGRVEDAAAQYMVVARAFYAHGVLAKARPYFERVLELKPDHAEALGSLLACLRQEGKDGEGERFVKAAAVAHLQAGRNEEAAALFESLPEAQRAGASALGAALLLQSGEVGQAERMAGQLELARPEMQDWFKRLGRSALERGDSVAADAYFRWAQGQAQTDAPVNPAPVLAAPAAILAPEPEPPAPPEPAPAPALAAPSPPAGLVAPPAPPPGLGAPPLRPAAVEASPAPGTPTAPEAAAVTPSGEDQSILQTMGEMCLAEEMFEEAKQVFERLSKAQPNNPVYWELLNRARAGLGLSPVMPGRASAPLVPGPVPGPASRPLPSPVPVAGPPAAPVTLAAPAAPTPVVSVPPAAPVTPAAPAVVTPAVSVPAVVPTPPAAPAPVIPAAPAPPPVPAPAQPALPVPPVVAAPAPVEPASPSGPAPTRAMAEAPAEPVPAAAPRPLAPPSAAPSLRVPAPPAAAAPVAAPVTPVPLAPIAAAAPVAPPALPGLAAAAATPATPWLPGLNPAPIAFKPVALPQRPVAPKASASKAMAVPVPGSARIERAAYTMQLGELPPAVPSDVDDNDEIIE